MIVFYTHLKICTKIGPCGPELIWHLANKCIAWITYKVNVVQIKALSFYDQACAQEDCSQTMMMGPVNEVR